MTTLAREQSLHLAELLRRERAALAEFLVALAEFDRRRLWLEVGHASLFYFLHRELGLAKGPAFYRKTAAELIQRYPEIVEPLRDGRLCLTSVVELSKVITPENRADVLPRFFELSKREAKEIAAALLPDEAAPRREVVTVARPAAASPAAPFALSLSTGEQGSPAKTVGASDASPAASVLPEEPARANASVPDVSSARPRPAQVEVEPLTAELRRLHVTVSRRFLEKLDAARAALSHSHPGAGAEEIIEAGLDLILQRHAKRRGLVERPRKDPPPAKPSASAPPRSRGGRRREHVPAHVMRAVWKRDGGRCQWAIDGGGICGSTHQVELDHIEPVARGGPSTIDNCRLLCRPHQDLAARKVFGDEWMDRFTRPRSSGEAARTAMP